eukprot:scaffold3240_cov187-Amphora_coffeaeformis.AAC.8
MDCIIPHHSVRMFCASIGACAKIGKDLYLDFDPIEGLTLRALNDAKSAYVCFKYQPSFFERCTAPPLELLLSEQQRAGRKRHRPTQRQSESLTDNDGHDEEDVHDDSRLTCRLSIKALTAAVRQRKHAQSLRIYAEQVASSLYLSFEYLLSAASPAVEDDGYPNTASWRVVHRVPVADFPVAIVSAVANGAGASHMIVSPRVLWRLLEPLGRHAETAVVIPSPTAGGDQILATCFQQIADNSSSSLLPSHLQTEMRLSFDDLVEMEFVDDRDLDTHNEDEDDVPSDVNKSVVLVFSHKEAKALLQWSSSRETEQYSEAPAVQMNFHWGGRPLVMEQQTDRWKVELVLATLDHKLLQGSMMSDAATTPAAAVPPSDNRQ